MFPVTLLVSSSSFDLDVTWPFFTSQANLPECQFADLSKAKRKNGKCLLPVMCFLKKTNTLVLFCFCSMSFFWRGKGGEGGVAIKLFK